MSEVLTRVPETEQRPNQHLDFFSLSAEDLGRLSESVKRSQGVVRVFVHPYFDSYNPKDADSKNSERIQAGIVSILNSQNAGPDGHNPPVILMEEEGSIKKVKGIVSSSVPNSQENVYFVPTAQASPKPIIKVAGKFERDDPWPCFRRILSDIGAKKILIGGMYFWSSGKNAKTLYGCVGEVIKQLSAFEIQVSNFTSPDSRQDIREASSKFHKYL